MDKTQKTVGRLFFLVNTLQGKIFGVFCILFFEVGTWLSLVEHSVRDAGVAGSNPVVPTIYYPLLPF